MIILRVAITLLRYVFYIFIIMIVSFVLLEQMAGYHFESDSTADYEQFLGDMLEHGKAEYGFLPKTDAGEVTDVYLYYSEEFLDDEYVIYVRCSFTPEQYETEVQRINEYTEQWSDMLETNLTSFSYDSLSIDTILYSEKTGFVHIDYDYYLFDPEDLDIIYVTICEEKLNGKSTNIPEEYLPSELVELRSK